MWKTYGLQIIVYGISNHLECALQYSITNLLKSVDINLIAFIKQLLKPVRMFIIHFKITNKF